MPCGRFSRAAAPALAGLQQRTVIPGQPHLRWQPGMARLDVVELEAHHIADTAGQPTTRPSIQNVRPSMDAGKRSSMALWLW